MTSTDGVIKDSKLVRKQRAVIVTECDEMIFRNFQALLDNATKIRSWTAVSFPPLDCEFLLLISRIHVGKA